MPLIKLLSSTNIAQHTLAASDSSMNPKDMSLADLVLYIFMMDGTLQMANMNEPPYPRITATICKNRRKPVMPTV